MYFEKSRACLKGLDSTGWDSPCEMFKETTNWAVLNVRCGSVKVRGLESCAAMFLTWATDITTHPRMIWRQLGGTYIVPATEPLLVISDVSER